MPSIILTRSRRENERTAPIIAALGLSVISVDGVEYQSIASTADQLDRIRTFRADAVLLSSSHAARLWFELLREDLIDLTIDRYLTVGERSAAIIRSAEPSAVIELTADAMQDVAEADLAGISRLLYPCSDARREAPLARLRARGIDVMELPLYRPVQPEGAFGAFREAIAAAEPPVAILFFSPSAVAHCIGPTSDGLPLDVMVAAIGETTAEALRALGLTPVVSSVPSAAVLAREVAHYLSSRH